MILRRWCSLTSTSTRGLRTVAVFVALAAVLVLAGCRLRPPTPTPYPCPQPTAELLWVEPVTSPTDELSQVVAVHMGNMEVVTITAESGVFTDTDGQVVVTLLPNTTHHLEVEALVKHISGLPGCNYGGYTLHTTRDQNGAPLTIVQGQPGRARAAAQDSQPYAWDGHRSGLPTEDRRVLR